MRGPRREHGARGEVRQEPRGRARAARSAFAGLIVAAALMVGAGLGAAAALTTSPAGASTAHSSLPPVNVSVSNTPTVNIGNQPTVNVGNFPEKPYNGTWRVQTENGHGNAQMVQCWSCWQTNSGTWAVNVSGSGVFKGLVLSAYQDGNGACMGANVYIDGRQMLGDDIWGAAQFGTNLTGIEGGQMRRNGAYADVMYLTPPGGLAFHSSLQVWVGIYGCGGSNPAAWRIWWSQTN